MGINEPMTDARPESQRGTPLSEGKLPLTPERAMRMQRTTQFVMSAVAATPDCPVLFVDVGEGFLSLAHVGDIDRLIRETQAPLLAEVERLRTALATAERREAEAREIVQAVAESTIVCNNYFDDGLPHAPAHVDDLCPRHPVKASTLRAQARAWLASSSSEAADARAASSAK